MSKLYRKSVIEKMSSPEQLDRMVVITKPSLWIAIAGGALIVLIALLWSILGGIPEKVDASGVYVSDSGTCVVSSETANIVKKVEVKSGDTVRKGDVLYSLKTDQMKQEKHKLENKLSQVESVTLTSSNDPETTETQNMLSIKAQAEAAGVNTAAAAYDVAKEEAEKARNDWQSKKKTEEKKKAAYETAVIQYGQDSPEAARAYTEYQKAVSDSTAAQSVYQSAKASLTSYKANSASSAAGAKASSEAYNKQFDAAKGAAISEIQSKLDEYTKLINEACVKAPIAGTVASINIADGSAVAEGTAAMVIHRDGGTGKCACYVGITDAQKVKPGMEVNVYPSNYDKQEYGHIAGKVISVDTTSSTETEVAENTGDPALAQAVLSSGPVVAFTCELVPDNETVSGYKWSTDKGKLLEVYEGTFITAEVISEKKKPISMMIPYLKGKFENMSYSDGEDSTNDTEDSK